MRVGSVGLVGWTNVGKSTLLNRLIGQKIAAVADVAQTTRNRIVGVRTDPDEAQYVFVDTPGIHDPRHRMNRAMDCLCIDPGTGEYYGDVGVVPVGGAVHGSYGAFFVQEPVRILDDVYFTGPGMVVVAADRR